MNNKKSKSMLYKERKKVIVKLLKEKKYDEIFNSYGQNIYCLYVPKKYRKKEIKELLKQGRFEDIYRRYGAKIYNKYVHIMKQYEIMYETGNKPKSIFERIGGTGKFTMERGSRPLMLLLLSRFSPV